MNPGPGRPARLSTEMILTAAIGLADAEGLEQLTMRRLGETVGVEAMAIYRYFPSRRALFDAIVEHLVTDDVSDPVVQLQRDDDWRDYLDRLAHGVRQVGLTHPRLFPLIATHPTEAPWLRPPLRSLRWVDTFLMGLQDHHFPPAEAAIVYKQFSAFLLGHLLLEVAALGLEQASDLAGPLMPPKDDDQQAAASRRHRDAREEASSAQGPSAPSEADILASSDERVSGTRDARGIRGEAAVAEEREATVVSGADIAAGDAVVSLASFDVASYPHVATMAGLLARDTSPQDFDRDLGRLLDQLAELRRP